MKTLNERATEILQALLAVRAYRIDHGNGVYTRLRAAMIGRNGKYNLISVSYTHLTLPTKLEV